MAADPQAAPPRAPDAPATSAVHPRAHAPAVAPTHPVVQAIDQLSDIVGVIGLTYYANHHPAMAAELYVFALCAVLGVQTGLRRGLGARVGAGVGAAAMLVLSLGQLLSAGANSQPGFLRVPRFVEHAVVAVRLAWAWATSEPRAPKRGRRGFTRTRTAAMMAAAFAVGALVLAPLAGALLASCELPKPDGCTPRDTRCSPAGIPEVCSGSQRWTHGATTPACSTWGASITCCLARTPYDGVRHACVPPVACLPETPSAAPDAGAESGAL